MGLLFHEAYFFINLPFFMGCMPVKPNRYRLIKQVPTRTYPAGKIKVYSHNSSIGKYFL